MVKVHYSLGLLSMLKGKKEKIEFNLKFKRCSNPRSVAAAEIQVGSQGDGNLFLYNGPFSNERIAGCILNSAIARAKVPQTISSELCRTRWCR